MAWPDYGSADPDDPFTGAHGLTVGICSACRGICERGGSGVWWHTSQSCQTPKAIFIRLGYCTGCGARMPEDWMEPINWTNKRNLFERATHTRTTRDSLACRDCLSLVDYSDS